MARQLVAGIEKIEYGEKTMQEKQELAERFKKIAIIITGHVADQLIPKYGTYFQMFVELLQPIIPNAEFCEFDVTKGQWPTDPQEFDLYVISGSRHGVYEDFPWIKRLEDYVRTLAETKRATLGICFGHQIMAQALGARVEKFDKGWHVGLKEYQEARPPKITPNDLAIFSSPTIHQDQVMTTPHNAKVWMKNKYCAIAGLRYEGIPLISIQAHPEFSDEYAQALLQERQELFPKDKYDQAITSYKRANSQKENIKQREIVRGILNYLLKY